MDRKKLLGSLWYLARPVLIYMLLFSTVQAILFRLLETVLLWMRTDMTIYYAYWESFFRVMVIAVAHSAAVLPLIREARAGIAWRERGDSWIAHRRDQNALQACLLCGTVCLAMGINSLAQRFLTSPQQDLSGWRLSAAVLVFGFVTPFTEELVFRGLLFGRLRQIGSFLEAGLLSAAVFGLYHGTVAQAVYGLIMGFVFAAAYELTGRFIVPVLLHGACNVFVLLASALGFWTLPSAGVWTIFWFTSAAAVILWFIKRLRETGWDPRRAPGRED